MYRQLSPFASSGLAVSASAEERCDRRARGGRSRRKLAERAKVDPTEPLGNSSLGCGACGRFSMKVLWLRAAAQEDKGRRVEDSRLVGQWR